MSSKKSIFSYFYTNINSSFKNNLIILIVLIFCLIKTNCENSKKFNNQNITKIENLSKHNLSLNLSLNYGLNLNENILVNLSITPTTHATRFQNSTINREKFLEERYGVRKKDASFIFYMSTVYILILICGILGNVSTCFVIFFNNCMHTTTNYYLFSLAVSDVLSLITGLPIELHGLMEGYYPWVFGRSICIIRTFIFETTTIASVLTILTFTFERWLHICKAIYAKKFSDGFSRVIKIVIFIWTLSGILSLPFVFTTDAYIDLENFEETRLCNIMKNYQESINTMIQIFVLAFFIVPMTLISIMYVLIGITLWKSQKSHKSTFNGEIMDFKSKKPLISPQINDQQNTTKNTSFEDQFTGQMKKPNNLVIETRLTRNMSNLSINNSIYNTSFTNQDIKSKESQKIHIRARQSRRDVVKMLCKLF